MDLIDKFRQWCNTNKKNAFAHQQFLQWFRKNEQRKIAYIEKQPKFWEEFVRKGYLTELEFELFSNYLKKLSPQENATNIANQTDNVSTVNTTIAPTKEAPTLVLEEKIPEHLGKYKILSKLGQGGMGIVYKVRHQELNQIYALKVIIAGEQASEKMLIRFHQEAKTMAKLKHPGIIQVVDSGEEAGKHFFVMEYVEGKTLDEAIEAGIPIRQGVMILKNCLDALHYAHTQGIIHRDLKPDNIFITKTHEPKIGDFGLAKELGVDIESKKLTQSGVLLGTPAYMSPEQIQGDSSKLTSRTDIYSIGVCLYQLLSKKLPFEDKSLHVLLYKIANEEALPPSKINSDVHRDLDTITLKSLEKLKHKRYQSAKAFGADLNRFLEGVPILARGASHSFYLKKWLKKHFLWTLFCLSLMLIPIIFFFYFQHNQKQAQLQRFSISSKNALEEFQKAKKINSKDPKEKRKKIQTLIKALNHLNLALSLKPGEKEMEKTKLAVAKDLILLACSTQDYQLAEYVAAQMKLSILTKEKQKKIIMIVEQQRSKVSREHQARFKYWVNKIRKKEYQEGEQIDAIFEIAKMKEPEIFKELIFYLAEGTNYFLQQKFKEEKERHFYLIMLEILGRLENPEAGEFLVKAIKETEQLLIKFSKNNRKETLLSYLELLAQALGNSKASMFKADLLQLKESLGDEFWKRIEFSYKKLVKVAEKQ